MEKQPGGVGERLKDKLATHEEGFGGLVQIRTVIGMIALAVLFIPGVASACCVYGFFKTINGQYSPKAYPYGTLLLLGMLLLSGPVASSDGLAVAGIPIPGWGLLVTMLAQGILFIHSMLENDG